MIADTWGAHAPQAELKTRRLRGSSGNRGGNEPPLGATAGLGAFAKMRIHHVCVRVNPKTLAILKDGLGMCHVSNCMY